MHLSAADHLFRVGRHHVAARSCAGGPEDLVTAGGDAKGLVLVGSQELGRTAYAWHRHDASVADRSEVDPTHVQVTDSDERYSAGGRKRRHRAAGFREPVNQVEAITARGRAEEKVRSRQYDLTISSGD